jgi:hypothetical protein
MPKHRASRSTVLENASPDVTLLLDELQQALASARESWRSVEASGGQNLDALADLEVAMETSVRYYERELAKAARRLRAKLEGIDSAPSGSP